MENIIVALIGLAGILIVAFVAIKIRVHLHVTRDVAEDSTTRSEPRVVENSPIPLGKKDGSSSHNESHDQQISDINFSQEEFLSDEYVDDLQAEFEWKRKPSDIAVIEILDVRRK